MKPSAWLVKMSVMGTDEPRWDVWWENPEAFVVTNAQPIAVVEVYTLAAAAEKIASDLEAGCLKCSWMGPTVIHKYCDECFQKVQAARHIRTRYLEPKGDDSP